MIGSLFPTQASSGMFCQVLLILLLEELEERQGCTCTYPNIDQPEDCSRVIKEIRKAAKKHSKD